MAFFPTLDMLPGIWQNRTSAPTSGGGSMSKSEEVDCLVFRALHQSTGTLPSELRTEMERHANSCEQCVAWLDAQNKDMEQVFAAYFEAEWRRPRNLFPIDEVAAHFDA